MAFNQGQYLALGRKLGGGEQDVTKAMVRETTKRCLHKERVLKGWSIKILSLFFIYKVANYQVYQDGGTTGLGKIGQ